VGIEDFEVGLGRRTANFAPLTPLVFLDWSADVYPEHVAVVHGARRYSWSATRDRCRRLASALAARGIGRGDTVAALLSNTPEMLEAHFGIPMTGAVLVPLNTRLDAAGITFILGHCGAKVLLVDRAFSGLAARAVAPLDRPPDLVDVDDSEYTGPGERIGTQEYESLLASADPRYEPDEPADEWQAISLNYTSGTTGDPKGVVVHHRGAHLNAVGNILTWDMPRHSVYLWTLPMFHCNGWCFPWTMAANAGTNVCLRAVEAAAIYRLIAEHRVTHYCGAPIVHNLLIDAPAELRATLDHELHAMIAAAPPPARTFEGAERLGIDLTHVYGLTEVYGPATVCAKHAAWADLDGPTRARRNGRQGVRYLLEDRVTVIDPATGDEVPADGETVGEIVFRGNITMMGYFKNPSATEEAFAGGWFHSGDLAVREPDGYVKIKDRAKDVIISGGENISSVEVEEALYRHPAVASAGVVAQPDEKWGETPCAYVELQPGASVSEAELIEHCRRLLPGFKVPRTVVFTEIPKTSTGKIQKHVLRQRSRSTAAIE
jgi:fatty-acyl-CoA synthase